MDPSPILALLFSLGAIVGGNALEGGHVSSLIALSPFMIVVGGTVGAVWLACTNEELKHAAKLMKRAVLPGQSDRRKLLDDMVKVSNVARREGMLAVENLLPEIQDEFLKRGLRMLVDGSTGDDVRRTLEPEVELEEHHGTAAAKVWESAGAYCPTVGILGAVLGLIHVMSNLDKPEQLGGGISVAFIGTVYGVGFANLVFLPIGNRLKKIVQKDAETRNMVLLGVVGIAAGVNARLIEEMLAPFAGHAKAAA
jgi:chemotaxis protein MotA